jgi:CheY-like chemotaxis protein
VLVLDLKMPVRDGLKASVRLIEIDRTLPTLIMTRNAEAQAERLSAFARIARHGSLLNAFNRHTLLRHLLLQER